MKKFGFNNSVGFFRNVGNDPFHLKQKVLFFISKSWGVEKEVIQSFVIETTKD